MENQTLIAGIGSVILLLFIPLAFLNGTTGFIPELFVFIALTWGFWCLADILRLRDPTFTLLVIGFILHACGILGWYHSSPLPIEWDHVSHFFGLLPWAVMFYQFMSSLMDAKLLTRKNFVLILLVFLAASGVGALIELSEFLGYLKFGFGEGAFRFGPGDGFETLTTGSDTIDAIGGGWINTGWDLIFDTLGVLTGILFCLIGRLFGKKVKRAYYFETFTDHSERID